MLREINRDHHIHYLTLDDGSAANNARDLATEYCRELTLVPFSPPARGSLGFGMELATNLFSPLPYAIARYRSAIDTAIRLSTLHNLSPIRGHTVVFVDVSGSMSCPCSTKGNMSSVQEVKDVAILLGLMLQSVCESCDFRLFSSPTPRSGNRPDVPVPLKEDVLLENIKRVKAAAGLLGGGTDFPGEYVAEMTKKGTRIDNFIILSDMMIAPGHQEMNMRGLTVSSLIGDYRRRVNPAMLFVAIDLFGAGKSLVSCTEGGSPNDVLITGFSDHVLRFIAERGNDKQLEYVRGIDRTKRIGEHKPVRPAAAGPGPALVAQPDALMIDA